MNEALVYLFFTKAKGFIRNIFSHAVSGILTILGIALMIGLCAMIMILRESDAWGYSVTDVNMLVMIYLGVTFFLSAIFFMQKRMALVYKSDANYIFSGPFSRKSVIGYILAGNSIQALLFGVMIAFYVMMMAPGLGFVTPLFSVFIIIMSVFIFATMLTWIDYFYIKQVANPKTKWHRFAFIGVIVAMVAALYLRCYLQNPGDLQGSAIAFVDDPTFYFVPLFGQAKLALLGYVQQDYISLFVGLAIEIAIYVVSVIICLNVKGDFYEKAIDDAEWVTELRAQAKLGRTKGEMDAKVKEVKNAGFATGAWAIASKNILDLRKTKSWLRKQEAFLLIFYLAIAYFVGMGFDGFKYYILVILLMSANNDFMVQELKKHYIYLVPDSPFKKIIALISPMAIKMLVEVIFGITIGWILFRVDVVTYLTGIVTILSYGLMFIAGTIWSIRLLKSGTNALAEQFIKMGVILVASIPAIVATVIILVNMGFSGEEPEIMVLANSYIAIASVASNAIVGSLFIWGASGMLKGANVMSD